MNYLELKKITFHAYHGVSEQEQKVGNTFTVDLKLFFNFNNAIQSDDLNDTVNYASIVELIQSEMSFSSNLLEHVAGRIVKKIKQAFPKIETVEIRLAKISPPIRGEISEAAIIIRD